MSCYKCKSGRSDSRLTVEMSACFRASNSPIKIKDFCGENGKPTTLVLTVIDSDGNSVELCDRCISEITQESIAAYWCYGADS